MAKRPFVPGTHRPGSVDIDSFYEDDATDLMTRFTNDVRRVNHKNSHRPRGRYGRGLAKKNGAGGLYTWGAAGSEFTSDQLENGIDPIIDNSDPLDPNYDSDSEENCKFETITPPLNDDEVEKYLTPVLMEYFEHGDTNEVRSTLEEVNLTGNFYRIPVVLISLALEKKSSHRELASILTSDLFGNLLKSEDIQKGFDVLLEQLDDLELDTPDATTVVGNFIARAIADDCIPPKYVTNAKEKLEAKLKNATINNHKQNSNSTTTAASSPSSKGLPASPIKSNGINNNIINNNNNINNNNDTSTTATTNNNVISNGHSHQDKANNGHMSLNCSATEGLKPAEQRAYKSLTYANSLINAKRGLIRLDTVWGLTGGARPVKYLIKQMRLLLKEYIVSLDLNEAERCLRELEVPHFSHEFVYEAILMGIEDSKKPEDLTSIAKLLKALSDINLISVDQMKKGFLRLFNEIPEIHIDVPHAYATLEKFMQSCFSVKLFLPGDVIDRVPSRGRKRFISEGDGGRIKE